MNRVGLAVISAVIFCGCVNVTQPVRPAKDSYVPTQFSVEIDGGAETVEGAVVTRDFFGGVRAFLGRFLVHEEFASEATAVVVISHRYWVERFKSDPSTIGRQIRISGRNMTIVGVAPPQFEPDPPGALWVPKVG
jgi:hypothetical protein